MRRYVVTGCARSGTMYITKILQALNEDVTQEVTFSPDLRMRDIAHWLNHGSTNEVAWEAAPYIDMLQAHGLHVTHLVRHPLAVIRSMLEIGLFAGRKPRHERHIVGAATAEYKRMSEIERASTHWLNWNRLCSNADYRVRVEDFSAVDATIITGKRITDLPFVATDTNATKSKTVSIDWRDIPQISGQRLYLRDEIKELAELYGYEV